MSDTSLTVAATINWAMWSAIATTAYALFTATALLGVWFIWRQLKAMDSSRRLEALNHMYSELHTDRSKADRRVIYQSKLDEFSDSDFDQLIRLRKVAVGQLEMTMESIERTADVFQFIGLLASKELIEKGILFEYFGWALLNSYRKLRCYITWMRGRGNVMYAQHFETLAHDFEIRFKSKYGETAYLTAFNVFTLTDT